MIYVDDMCFSPMGRFRNMRMSHLIADTVEELHRFAAKIGLKRSWFQDKLSGPHYDISMSKRRLAIFHGAREISMKECAAICWCQRSSVSYSAPWRALFQMKAHFLTELQGREDDNASSVDANEVEPEGDGAPTRSRLTRRRSRSNDRTRLSAREQRVAAAPNKEVRVRLSRHRPKKGAAKGARDGRTPAKKRHS